MFGPIVIICMTGILFRIALWIVWVHTQRIFYFMSQCCDCSLLTALQQWPSWKEMVEREGSKKEVITVEVKKEIMEKQNWGMPVADITRLYKSQSTICTI